MTTEPPFVVPEQSVDVMAVVASVQDAWLWHEETVALCQNINRGVMEIALRLYKGQQEGYIAAIGYETLVNYLDELPVADSRSSIFRAIRLIRDVLPLITIPAARVTSNDVVQAGPKKLDMVRRLIELAPSPEIAGEWVSKAATLSETDLRREVLSARGYDMDADWRDNVEWGARELRRQANKLEGAADRDAAIGILDDVVARAQWVRAKL